MILKILPKRLDLQIASLISLLLIFLTGIFSYIAISHSTNDLLKSLSLEALVTSQKISQLANNSISDTSPPAIERTLFMAMKQKEINSIVIVDGEGFSIESINRNQKGEISASKERLKVAVPQGQHEQISIDVDHISAWSPSDINSQPGWIQVNLSLQNLKSHRNEHILASVIFSIVAITITFFIILLFLRKPFNYIKEAARFAEIMDSNDRGKLSTYSSSIELKTLGESLNLASHRLEVNEKEILSSLELLETQTFAMDQHSIVSITDTQGKITYANNKFCQTTEYTKSELLGKNHSMLKSDHHSENFFQELWLTITRGKVWQGEICNKTKSDNEYWTNTTIVPFLDKNNIPYQYAAIRNDITALKKTTQELIDSQQRLQQSQQFANIGSWELVLATNEVFLSDNTINLLGNPPFPKKIMSENYIAIIHHEDRKKTMAALRKCIKTGEMYQAEYRVIWQDDSVHWIQDNGNVLRDEKGNALRILGIAQDITERKKAAEEIESIARFPNENPNPIMRISHNMQLLYGNPVAHELMAIWEIKIGDTVPDCIINIAMKNIRSRRNSTAEISVASQFYAITVAYVPGSDYLNLYMQDITERKAAEQTIKNYQRHLEDLVEESTEDLVKARDAALAAERSMSTFLANMSHELRTPLHAVLSFADFGMKKIDRVSKEKVIQYFSKIHQSGNHLLGLVNNLLDLSKLRAGKMSYHYTDSKIAPVIQQVINELTLIARKKNIDLVFHDQQSDLKTFIDTDRIAQVMRNLVSNAIKFSDNNENIQITLNKLEDSALEVCVIDKGVGIPENELELIFESFVQSSKTNTYAGGTGLGLPICREIVEAGHGGWIKADNMTDGGAAFTFWIPIQHRENEPSYSKSL